MRTHQNRNTAVPPALALLLAAASAGAEGEEWGTFHWRNPFPTGNSLGEIAFGDGKFVAVDGYGHLYHSTGGLGWTRQLSPAPTYYSGAIGYGAGRFVTVGYFGTIVSSEGDGWVVRPSGNSEILSDVAYGNGWFVVVNNGNGVTRSQDGVNWTHISDLEPQPYLHYVVFGNGVFVGINHGPNALVSLDGAAWTAHGITAPTNAHVGLTYVKGKFFVRAIQYFVSGTYESTTYSSIDGKTWNPEPTVPHPRGAAAGDDVVVMLTGRRESTYDVEELSASSDGIHWVSRDAANQATLRGLAYGNGLFVGVGEQGEVVRSTNGVDWSRVGGDRSFSMNGGVYHDGKYVFVGDTILISSNGTTFERVNGAVDGRDVAQGGGIFVMVGAGGQVMRSTNGLAWMPAQSGTTRTLHGIAHGAGTFVVVGDDGVIRASQDGLTWQGALSDTEHALKDVVFAQGKFVAVGGAGTILTSADGLAWTPQHNDDFNDLEGVAFGNERFVAVGFHTILTSPSGAAWEEQEVTFYYPEIKGIAFGGGTFLIRASDGDYIRGLFRSVNGRQWTEQQYGTSSGINGLNFLNGTFMLFGGYGMILQSDPIGAVVLSGAFTSTADDFEVTLSGAEIGRAYRLQGSTDLSTATWNDVIGFTATQSVTKLVIPVPPASLQRFYRAVSP